jgi:endonuclease-3 related protein
MGKNSIGAAMRVGAVRELPLHGPPPLKRVALLQGGNGRRKRSLRRLSRRTLRAIYERLSAHFGPQNWWPGESGWEIMVGAILTQNTAWRNVEKALDNLKRADRLAPARLLAARRAQLTRLVRPAGFTSVKPKRLKGLARFLLDEHGGDPAHLRITELPALRERLLALEGIGPETADAILLYVAEHPIFVVDAYTRRILSRMGYVAPNVSYAELQDLIMKRLPRDRALYGEFHALLDVLGKEYCFKRAPRCAPCPLNRMCEKRLA